MGLSLTGCSNSDSDDPPEKSSDSPTNGIQLKDACEGIFDKGSIREAEDPHAPELVRTGSTEKMADVAEELSSETDTTGMKYDPCILVDDQEKNLISIQASWTSPSRTEGNAVKYDFDDPSRATDATLAVPCHLKNTDKGADRSLLFTLRDGFNVDMRSRAKLITAAAKKVTSAMKCDSEPAFPNDPGRMAPEENKGTDLDGDGKIDRIIR
ncbi:hypothetical protein [Streptomyces phytohabitans]|uniref:hypothetical protein n=1 Tax=Streptomyces phytohabitans TaxID=1150371 RepID=UPI00345C2E9C